MRLLFSNYLLLAKVGWLTAGEEEVAVVAVEGELAELHRLADHRDVRPDKKYLDIFKNIS